MPTESSYLFCVNRSPLRCREYKISTGVKSKEELQHRDLEEMEEKRGKEGWVCVTRHKAGYSSISTWGHGHLLQLSQLFSYITSNRPQGDAHHAQDNQAQASNTPQNTSLTPAYFFLQGLKGTVRELPTSALHPLGNSLSSREPSARNMHSASTPGYCFLQVLPFLPIHFKSELTFTEILYGILSATQSHKMLSFYKVGVFPH